MKEVLLQIRAGDRVIIDGNLEGDVLFNAFTNSYSAEYPISDWPLRQYNGIMIMQKNGSMLFHPISLFETGQLTIELAF